MLKYFYIAVLIINSILFLMYGVDKFKAKHNMWRISEFMLIAPAYIFASFGAMLGMIVFNHKTSKTKFRILVPLSFIFNVICAIAIKKWLLL
ncbi:MAG: DUF1294 domain-containing protein [Clostridia bacterium]|nr:DUF1294 domain-containing protein [Clostridia bacterium]